MAIEYEDIPKYIEPEHLLQDGLSLLQQMELDNIILILDGKVEGKRMIKKMSMGKTKDIMLLLRDTINEIIVKVVRDAGDEDIRSDEVQ